MELDIKIDNKTLLNKFSKGVGINLLLRLKGVIYVPILINILSKEDVGIISLLQSLTGLFLGMALLNLPDSSNRYLINQKREDAGTIVSFIVNASFILFVLSAAVIFIIFRSLEYKDLTFYLLLLILLFSKIINKLSVFVFEVFQETNTIIRNTFLVEYLSLAIILLLYFLNVKLNLLYVVVTQVLIVVSVSIFYLRKIFTIYNYRLTLSGPSCRAILKTGIIMLPVSYGTWVIQNSDYILVEHYLGSSVLATYSFSYSLASIVTGLSAAVTFFWYSAIVKMIEDKEQVMSLVNKTFSWAIVAYLGIIAFYSLMGKPVIAFINKEYMSSLSNLLILIPGFFLGLLIQLLSGVIYALKKEKALLVAWVLGALINLVLNFLFLKKFGVEFASLVTTLSYTIIYIILLGYTLNRCRYLLTKKFILVNAILLIITLSFTFYNFRIN